MPRAVLSLENKEKVRKERLALEEKKNKAKMERLELKEKGEKGEKAPKSVKSSRKRPDVGEKNDFADFIEKAQADTLSEDTAIEADDEVQFDKEKEKKKKQVKFAGTDDDSSSISYDPYEK